MAYAAVDIQMLRGVEGEYIIKEFSLYDTRLDVNRTVVFGPPCAESMLSSNILRENYYVVYNFHGLRWNCGSEPYHFLPDILRTVTCPYMTLYVKGRQKKTLLQSFLNIHIVDVEEMGCPKLDTLPQLPVRAHCAEHTMFPLHSCAAVNAKRIGLWYEFNKA